MHVYMISSVKYHTYYIWLIAFNVNDQLCIQAQAC